MCCFSYYSLTNVSLNLAHYHYYQETISYSYLQQTMVLLVVLHVWGLYKVHKMSNEKARGIIEVPSKQDDYPLMIRLLMALNPCKDKQLDADEVNHIKHNLCIKFRNTLDNQPYVLNLQNMIITCDKETKSILIYDKDDILQYAINEWKFLTQTHEHNVWIDVHQSEFGKDPISRLGIKCEDASSADYWRREITQWDL